MRRIRNLQLWVLLFSPLVCAASELLIPETATKLNELPAPAAGSEVFRRPTAVEVITPVGPAILSVRREDTEVPSGRNLSDSGYRAELRSRFDKTLDPKIEGVMTSVGGSPGWTLVDARKDAHSHLSVYTLISYVIVDRHLYRFMVRAVGTPARPAEFDGLAKAIGNVTFTTPQSIDAASASGAGTGAMKLPPSVGDPGRGLIVGLKQHAEGVAGLDFTIDGQGHPQGAKLLYADPPNDGVLALAYLQSRLFGVPADWEESGSQNVRFKLEFQFPVSAGGASCGDAASPARIPDVSVVRVCLNGS